MGVWFNEEALARHEYGLGLKLSTLYSPNGHRKKQIRVLGEWESQGRTVRKGDSAWMMSDGGTHGVNVEVCDKHGVTLGLGYTGPLIFLRPGTL